jgi:hypothetical protein
MGRRADGLARRREGHLQILLGLDDGITHGFEGDLSMIGRMHTSFISNLLAQTESTALAALTELPSGGAET